MQRDALSLQFVAVQDSFGESGKPADLMKKYGIAQADVVAAASNASVDSSYLLVQFFGMSIRSAL